MKNWKPYLLAYAVALLGAYLFTGRQAATVPADLRDAVADAGGQLGTAGQPASAPKPKLAVEENDYDNKVMAAFARLKAETGAAGETPYQILEDMFKKGAPAEAGNAAGWYYTLVARSPKKAFFGVNGAAVADQTPDYTELRVTNLLYHENFDLNTPITPKMRESMNAMLDNSPVKVRFPPGTMRRGDFGLSYREFAGHVIVKNAGVKVKDAKPPFDHPVFYVCYMKKI